MDINTSINKWMEKRNEVMKEDEASSVWKQNVSNLLYNKSICGICLKEEDELIHWDDFCLVKKDDCNRTLEEIIAATFGKHVPELLPTPTFCTDCVKTIITSFEMVKKITSNQIVLQKYIKNINEQINYLNIKEHTTKRQLLLTIDNVESLNVPSTVMVKENMVDVKITNEMLDETNDVDSESEQTEYYISEIGMRYECPYCGQQFKEYNVFKEHYKRHHEKFYRCHKCLTRTMNFKNFISHRETNHNDKLLTCTLCKIILLQPNATEHTKEHKDVLFCEFCSKIFDKKSELNDHINEAHSKNICDFCFRSFDKRIKVEKHRCKFKCLECEGECLHRPYLESYRDQYYAPYTEYTCMDCNYIYLNRSQLVAHVNEYHLNHFPYLCDLCGDKFPSQRHLRQHTDKKHPSFVTLGQPEAVKEDNDIFNCDFCTMSFNTVKSYSSHVREHMLDESDCQFCNKSFDNIKSLKRHLREYHATEFKNSGNYQCTMCPKNFPLRRFYLKHLASHPKGSNYICRECKIEFRFRSQYYNHMRQHKKVVYDLKCPICFKEYTKHKIQTHIKHHFSKGLNNCELCGEGFKNCKELLNHASEHKEVKRCIRCRKNINAAFYSQHLNTHKSTEPTNLKYCDQCEYFTRFAPCMEAHINRHHLKTRPFVCDVCSKRFYAELTLREHKLTHKEERPELCCHVCGNKFISKKALMLHMRLHTGDKPYPCEYCDLKFLSASRRRQHELRKHFEPSVVCEICSKKFYTQYDVRRHTAKCHSDNRKGKKYSRVIIIEENEKVVESEEEYISINSASSF